MYSFVLCPRTIVVHADMLSRVLVPKEEKLLNITPTLISIPCSSAKSGAKVVPKAAPSTCASSLEDGWKS